MSQARSASLEEIADYLRAHGLTLSTGESCTAGLIAATVADIPGAGDLLTCAFVTYTPEAKQQCLGVRQETIDAFGLTSEEVAREMALGALARSSAALAIADTGVADDAIAGIPAGTQCFAWAFRSHRGGAEAAQLLSETRRFDGDRKMVREAAAAHALKRIRGLHEAVVLQESRSEAETSASRTASP